MDLVHNLLSYLRRYCVISIDIIVLQPAITGWAQKVLIHNADEILCITDLLDVSPSYKLQHEAMISFMKSQ